MGSKGAASDFPSSFYNSIPSVEHQKVDFHTFLNAVNNYDRQINDFPCLSQRT